MPRFYFEINNSHVSHDDEGVELPDMDAVRRMAMTALPRIASDELAGGDDWRHFTLLVTAEDGRVVYSAVLTYTGQCLLR